ncbi:MAG: hypothetical protein ABI639_03295 [Thermoanaerobaculia bacterium]
MGLKIWVVMGALAGLVAGLLLDTVIPLPPLYMRLTQLAMIVFGALIAGGVYEGARVVTQGREPSVSTDVPRRRWIARFVPRRPRA